MNLRKRKPDKFKAQSMLLAAEREAGYIRTLPPSQDAAPLIIRSIYEDFRMLGDALLLIRGKEASGQDHHTIMINELFTLEVSTARPIRVLSNLKTLRHKINYQGYLPHLDEVQDALSILEACFKPLLEAVRKELAKL